jgi:nucleoside-diphosphate-sugar epimerase
VKKILITGISSFIGFHLAKYFNKNENFEVIGTLTKNIFEYNGIQSTRLNILKKEGITFEKLNLTDSNRIRAFINAARPNIWINHAGYAENYGSFDYDLKKGMNINVYPLYTIYPALKQNGCEGIIITGTNAEYSDSDVANKETDRCFPTTPYGLSKLMETLAAKQLSDYYGLTTRVARVYVPFGPLDSPKKLLPYLINQFKKNQHVELSPCLQKRDFIYVEDLARGYETLLNDFSRNSVFDIFNLCSGKAARLKDLLLMIVRILDSNPELLNFGARKMRPGEPDISYGSIQKAIDILNWKPLSLQEGLKHYINTIKKR